ncbi:MAG: peptidoglycan editing factor PgeF [Clostridiales bacterium]|nr:peptidoglycan editing factor PgeF [Clostridiales bacterium]
MKIFNSKTTNGVKYYAVSLFEKTGIVKTGFSTRFGGVSSGRFESMNFSFITGDKKENVLENYKRYCDALDIDINKMVLTRQIHKDDIHTVDENDFGAMINRECTLVEADALITDKTGVTLVKFSADCPVIYLLDTKKKVAALVHSGWRSTAMNIVGKTIEKMKQDYGCNTDDILSAIGPSIKKCCFEVGEEVAGVFEESYGEEVIDRNYNKPHVSLKDVLTQQLKGAGIRTENITQSDICTGCQCDEFHSYRIKKGECGLSIGTITLI